MAIHIHLEKRRATDASPLGENMKARKDAVDAFNKALTRVHRASGNLIDYANIPEHAAQSISAINELESAVRELKAAAEKAGKFKSGSAM